MKEVDYSNNQAGIPHRYSLEMFDALIGALKELGGAESRPEVARKAGGLLGLKPGQLDHKRKPADSNTVFVDELHWTKWALDRYGLTESPRRGLWQLTDRGWSVNKLTDHDRKDIIRTKDKYLKSTKAQKGG